MGVSWQGTLGQPLAVGRLNLFKQPLCPLCAQSPTWQVPVWGDRDTDTLGPGRGELGEWVGRDSRSCGGGGGGDGGGPKQLS